MNAEDVIRRVLEAEAATVEVRPDALGTIRDRIDARRRRRWFPAALAAGLSTAAAVTVGVVALDRPGTPPPAPNPPAATAASASPAPARLPVYYVGPDDRLYREYHASATGSVADRVRTAVTEMLRDSADDPDYRTAWPAGVTVRDVTVDGVVASVDLSADPPGPLAREQLIWTVTAVTGGDTMRLGGARVTRGPALDVLAPVWLVDPQAGSINPARIAVTVYAVSADGTVRLRVTGAGQVAYEGVLALDRTAPGRGVGRTTLPALPPGEYTVEAATDDGADAHDVQVG